MKVAIVSDPLTIYGGAERVIDQILSLFPTADIFSIVDTIPNSQRTFLGGRAVQTSFIQRFPGGGLRYQNLFPLWPIAIEQIDVSAYDLVISSHHSVVGMFDRARPGSCVLRSFADALCVGSSA